MTWNIHGRKQIVWRCINRLEFGKRYCGDSPSIPEEALHAAIVKSIQSLLDGRQEELASYLQGTIENYCATMQRQVLLPYKTIESAES